MTSQTDHPISRRSALAGLGAGGLGLALANAARPASAQDAAPVDYAGHPMAGMWLATVPNGVGPSLFAADGTCLQTTPLVSVAPDGSVQFETPGLGTWEPDGERGAHFTVVRVISDAAGAFVGTGTVDGYPVANDDGQSFYDDGTRVRVTVRDAAGAVTVVLGEDGTLPAISGVRMGPGNPGFSDGTPEAGTPTT